MQTINAKQKHDLKRFIKNIESFRGRGTELVSVYIPAGYELSKITTHLAQEQGTAVNIKSSSTRKNVIDALERMIQHLKLYDRTPPHGLAAFSGNVAEREGQSDVKVWSIEPPLPLNIRIYRCDKQFVLEPLVEQACTDKIYGLVVLDRRDATIAELRGKKIVVLQQTHSEVPGKMRAGGQSAPRFARLRELAIKEHYKKVADYMKDQFLGKDLQGILIGGPSTTVTDFINKDYLTGDVKKKILGTKDLCYTDDFGLQELVDLSTDILASEEVAEEKQLMQRFFTLLNTDMQKVAYGYHDVEYAMQMGAVDVLLLSELLEDEHIEHFEQLAEAAGTEVKIISTETREGEQLKAMGKVAALLRYPVQQ
ncbi:MAG: peptide chain release factor aRF-1 [Candidatus Woesearchaeota archaeon]